MPDPWDRLPDETDKAWLAFGRYLNAGPERSFKSGEREPVGGTWRNRKPSGTVCVWAKRHRWRERASAWDHRLAKKAEEVKIDETARRAREQLQRRSQADDDDWVAGNALLLKAMELLEHPAKPTVIRGPDGLPMTVEAANPAVFRVASQLVLVSSQLRRTAVGLASRFSATGRLPADAAVRVAGAAVPPAEDKPQQTFDDDMPAELAERIRSVIVEFAMERSKRGED